MPRFIPVILPSRCWLLLMVFVAANVGCIYRRAADLDRPITPSIPCHNESCGPNCTTTVHVDHIPAPLPDLPDPRTAAPKVDMQMSLRDALVLGIERSRVARTQTGPQGVVVNGTIYDQQIANALRHAELGIFDTVVGGNLLFPNEKNPPGTSFNGFAIRPTELHRSDFDLYALQKLRRGGSFSLSHTMDYLYVPGGIAPINPQYQSSLEAAYTQPLLRGHGEFVTAAPIAIKATQANQSVWEFKLQLLRMARQIEVSYWEYQSAHQQLELIEETLPILEEIVTKLESRVDADRATRGQVARAKASFYTLKDQRIEAQRIASEKEFLLRNLLGLPPTDGHRIVPTDSPLLGPLVYDWQELLQVAMHKRPEVIRQRLAVHVANLEWKLADNAVLPQVDTYVALRSNGLNDDLGDSWRMMFAGENISVNAGLIFEAPWQRTRDRGNLRAAHLKVAKERELLTQLGHQISHELANVVRDLDAILNEYEVAEDRIEAADEWTRAARAIFDNPSQESNYSQTFDRLLRAVQSRLNAGSRYIDVVRNYNIALVMLEEKRGTLLEGHAFYVEGDPTQEANHQLDQNKEVNSNEDVEGVPAPAPPKKENAKDGDNQGLERLPMLDPAENRQPPQEEARQTPGAQRRHPNAHRRPVPVAQRGPSNDQSTPPPVHTVPTSVSASPSAAPLPPVVVESWIMSIDPKVADAIAATIESVTTDMSMPPRTQPTDDSHRTAASSRPMAPATTVPVDSSKKIIQAYEAEQAPTSNVTPDRGHKPAMPNVELHVAPVTNDLLSTDARTPVRIGGSTMPAVELHVAPLTTDLLLTEPKAAVRKVNTNVTRSHEPVLPNVKLHIAPLTRDLTTERK